MTRFGSSLVLHLTVILAIVSVESSSAGCVTSNFAPGTRVNTDAYFVKLVGFTSSQASNATSGLGDWNKTSCNRNIGGIRDFPVFVTQNEPGAITVTVTMHSGFNPRNNRSCGFRQGNRINLYTDVWDADEDDPERVKRRCNRADILRDTMAHEVGHVLGLRDQAATAACQGFIMAEMSWDRDRNRYNPRSILGSECTKVRTTNQTNAEQEADDEEDSNCGSDCDPYDPCEPDCGSPILLDLDRNLFSLTDLSGGVDFDIDADGHDEETAWTRSDQLDAFLCLDRDGSGRIDHGGELFGDATPLADGTTAENGYVALAEFDTAALGGNGDGKISPQDDIYSSLQVWVDQNHDGLSDVGEMLTLSEAGVAVIDTAYRESVRTDRYGNLFAYIGRAWLRQRGVVFPIKTTDVFFKVNDTTP